MVKAEPLRANIKSLNSVPKRGRIGGVRTYLVVIDENDEARVALRFAARRARPRPAARSKSLGIDRAARVRPVGWRAGGNGGRGAARADALVAPAAGELIEETGLRPAITVRQGEPVAVVRQTLADRPDTAALVLGAAAGRAR